MVRIWDTFWSLVGGHHAFSTFFYMFITVSVLNAFLAILFRSRKIQPKGFKWKTYRNEVGFGLLNGAGWARWTAIVFGPSPE